jgi:hypothetical protein
MHVMDRYVTSFLAMTRSVGSMPFFVIASEARQSSVD